MSQILVIQSSPLRTESFSNKLSQQIVSTLQKKNPGSQVKVRDLVSAPPPLLTKIEFGVYSDEAIAEIEKADVIVLNVATHNFSIPAVLKAWIDQITRASKTFAYTAEGPKGLVTGKHVILAIASGAVHSTAQSTPQAQPSDFTESYLRYILSFLGMTDIQTFRVEGLAIPGIKESALEKALALVSSKLN